MFSQLVYSIKQKKMLKSTQSYCSKASPAGSPTPKTSFLFGYLLPCSLALHTCACHTLSPLSPTTPRLPLPHPAVTKKTKRPFTYNKYILYFPENGQHRAGDEARRPYTEHRPVPGQLHRRQPRGRAQPRRGPWLPPAGPGGAARPGWLYSVYNYTLSLKKGLPAIAGCSN